MSQNKIASIYDSIAPIYDIWGKLTESRARNRAIELAEINDGQSILEVAVGTGLAFYEIVKSPMALIQVLIYHKGCWKRLKSE